MISRVLKILDNVVHLVEDFMFSSQHSDECTNFNYGLFMCEQQSVTHDAHMMIYLGTPALKEHVR